MMETELPVGQESSHQLSLKEAVLFRKLRNDQKLNSLSEKPIRQSSVDAKELSIDSSKETPDEIRSKLLRNRQKLDLLLQNAPGLLNSKCIETESKDKDLNNQAQHLSLDFYQTAEPKRHDAEESSTDEEMKEPVNESPLQLSDSEVNIFSRSLPNSTNSPMNENNTAEACQTKSDVFPTSSRTSSLFDKQTSMTSSAGSLYYEIAKPKPPPRLRKSKNSPSSIHKSIDLDPKEAKSILLRDNSTRSVTSLDSQSSVKENQSKNLNKRSLSFEKSESSKSTDNLQTERAGYITGPEALKATSGTSLSRVLTKSDSSSNAATNSSSDYFSPRSGSTSITPSNSNASSTTSSGTSLKFRSGRSSQHSQTSQKSEESEATKVSNKTKKDMDQELNHDDEDVFPVKFWVESTEYANLVEQTNISKESDKVDINENSISPTDDSPPPETFKKPLQPVYPKPSLARKPKIVNSISMVEQPVLEHDLKTRSRILPNGVRLRIPGNRSKKSDASRNSRAFALQLKQLSEESYSPPVEDRMASNFPASSNYRSISTVNPPTPLKSIPLQDLQPNLLGSFTPNVRNRPPASSEKLYNTVSGATGRHLSASSTFFCDETERSFSRNSNEEQGFTEASTNLDGSTWSLAPPLTNEENAMPAPKRKTSITNRLKGALSFQNIRKAISMERLDEEEKMKSLSHSYINELGQDISQTTRQRSNTTQHDSAAPPPGRLQKAPSISSIFTTVRMRKRKSRERRAAKLRNTIAIDPKDVPEIDYSSEPTSEPNPMSSRKVSTPGHLRSIGRVLDMNAREGSLLVEMEKPSNGPFSFCIARRKETGNVYITNMNDSYPNKMYAGLMKLGDEITEVNGMKVDQLTLDQIYDVIFDNKTLTLRIKPSQIHVV